jgi:hypothetical protein
VRKLKEAFFHDPETHQTITQLAQADPLVIYAGAGVTIDRTTKSWASLIAGLLDEKQLGLSADDIDRIIRVHGNDPVKAASVAYELYVDAFMDRAEGFLIDRLHELLYPKTSLLLSARLSDSIALLMDTWRKANKTVVLVTPNYEDVLLEKLSNLPKTAPDIFYVGRDNMQPVLQTTGMKYVYMHGSVPYVNRTSPVKPVLVERDYFESEQTVRAALTELFTGSTVLMLGTSLQDPPLLAALNATRTHPSSSPTSQRYPIVPMQSSEWETPDLAAKARLADNHIARLRHFEVNGIYPDYYSQLAQLVEEVRECAAKGTPYESSGFTSRYGQRLVRWWDGWSTAHMQTATGQMDDHLELLRLLNDELRPALQADRDEPLKLELWIRRDPANRRKLALWASSLGSWSSTETMREATIEANSEFVAVRVLCEGKALLPQPVGGGRWQTFIGAPLFYDDHSSVPTPVGAVVLASMRGPSDTSIREAKGAKLEAARELMSIGATKLINI